MQDVYLISASRTPSTQPSPDQIDLCTLLAQAVNKLPEDHLASVDTVFVTHRYPLAWSQSFVPARFLDALDSKFDPDEEPRFFVDSRSLLGGIDTLQFVFHYLRHRPEPSKVLVVGGEVFDLGFKGDGYRTGNQAEKIRDFFNEFGGLANSDREYGFTPTSANCLIADAMMRRYLRNRDQLEDLMCCITTHLEKYARLNPYSYQYDRKFAKVTTVEYRAKRATREKKWPFNMYDICGINNGAGALILSNHAEDAESPMRIKISDCVIDKADSAMGVVDRQPLEMSIANKHVWNKIKRRLKPVLRGRNSPILVELYDTHAFQIAQSIVDFQLAGYDTFESVLQGFNDGIFDPLSDHDGNSRPSRIDSQCKVILNPSGGSKDGHPHGGFALVKAAECFFQLTGNHPVNDPPARSGVPERLVLPLDHVKFALVQNLSGSGNTAGIVVLERV